MGMIGGNVDVLAVSVLAFLATNAERKPSQLPLSMSVRDRAGGWPAPSPSHSPRVGQGLADIANSLGALTAKPRRTP